jgi:hypothetical protein
MANQLQTTALEATTAQITAWTENPDGSIHVVWQDGSSTRFLNLDEIRRRISTVGGNRELTENLLFAWFLARQPEGKNAATVLVGKTLTFDLSVANPIRVQ